MRRLLLSTTALALLSVPHAACAADKISLTLGGYFRFFGVAGTMDDDTGDAAAGFRGHGVARESEVYFFGSTALDNGMKVGVTIQLEGETSGDQIDESYVWFEGSFGRLELGAQDPPGEQRLVGAPGAIDGHGVNSPTFFHVPGGANAVGTTSTYVTLTFDRDKVIYFTPRFAGFQFGVSYTPDRTEELGFALRPDTTPAQQSEAVEVAAHWQGSVGEADLEAFGAYSEADVEAPPPGFKDQVMWGVGAEAAWAGFTVGASYRFTNRGLNGPNADRRDWNVGIAYAWSVWRIAAAWGHGEVEAGLAGGEDELDQIEVGLRYQAGPGVHLFVGGQHVDYDDNLSAPGAENEAFIAIAGTRLSF
ncbi:MAG: porin [Alphaproteobacteria bacterium]